MDAFDEHARITVGLLGIHDTDDTAIEEIVKTVRAQDLSYYELLICPDSENETLIQEMVEWLYVSPSENCLKTTIQPFSYQCGTAEAMEWIIKNAAGEFLIFHTLSETLYDTHVLSNYWNAFQGREESLGFMRTLVMKRSDQSWRILPEMEAYAGLTGTSPEEQVQWLKSSGKSVCNGGICFRTAALREIDLPSDAYEENFFSIMLSAGRNGVLVCPEYCATRHYCAEFPENDSLLPLYITQKTAATARGDILNLTDYLALETAVNAALKICGGPFHRPDDFTRHELSEKLTRLCAQIRAKAQGGVWALTDSQRCLLQYLEKLIHLLDFPGRRVSDYKWLLADAGGKRRPQFRVAFFVNEYAVWPSLQSTYEAVQARPDMEAQLVYLPFRHASKTVPDSEEWAAYHAAGYRLLSHNQYDISRECPDAAVYVKPYDDIPHAFTIGETHRVIPRCVYIPYGMETADNAECLKYQCHCPMQFHAWRAAAYCKDYYEKMRRHTYRQGENYLPCGHPRIDLRFQDYSGSADYRAVREKAGTRRIVLWNSHFGLEREHKYGTFFQYKDAILDYFNTHTDLFLLWRPHPLFCGALAKLEGKALPEITAWFDSLHMRENFYIDRSRNYLPAFAASDAMISDQASFVPEYLAWGKPLIVTRGPETPPALYHTLETYLHFATEPEHIAVFLETIRTGDLPAPSVSEKVSEEMFIPREGTVGGYLAEYLSRQIRKEQAELLEGL